MIVKEEKLKLEKTTAEQEIIRTIEALESSLEQEVDDESKKALEEQITSLKGLLQNTGDSQQSAEKDSIQPDREKELRHMLYRLLLKKYSGTISEAERKTVGELKALVNSEDLTVQSIAMQAKRENYVFEKHYPEAMEKAFESLEGIEHVSLDSDIKLNFWLTPREMLSEKIADHEDFALLLCSILLALGDENASVVVAELDDLETHAFVVTEYREKFFLLDPCRKKDEGLLSGNKEECLEKYSFNGAGIKRFLFKFNNKDYEEFTG